MSDTYEMKTDTNNTAGHDCRDMFSPHHPRCENYMPTPDDPRFARFGEAMWEYIAKLGGDFCGEEISEDILPLAQAAGLCCRVEFDPEIHGEGIEADPGDEIWWWGDSWTNSQDPAPEGSGESACSGPMKENHE